MLDLTGMLDMGRLLTSDRGAESYLNEIRG